MWFEKNQAKLFKFDEQMIIIKNISYIPMIFLKRVLK